MDAVSFQDFAVNDALCTFVANSIKVMRKKHKIYLVLLVVFAALFLSTAYHFLKPQKSLPVYNPVDVNPELVDPTVQHTGRDHKIADFSFTNQNGKTVTQEDYKGKIYVADFFFTTCQTICPIMAHNMVTLQKAILKYPDVMLLSHSVTPETDSVPVLKAYAVRKGVDDKKWNLVTGDKDKIYEIARKSYLAVKTTDTSEYHDMVHTENFVLVDKKRRIRGFYDGTKFEEIERLLRDIEFLRTED